MGLCPFQMCNANTTTPRVMTVIPPELMKKP